MAVADLNADGRPDIVAARLDTGSLFVYLNDGRGGFTTAGSSPVAAGPSPEDVAIADVNGDGHLDVAVTNHETDALTVLLGNGQGQLASTPQSLVRVGSRPHQHGIATGDFNADGRADLAVDSRDDDAVFVIHGDGRGRFADTRARLPVGRAPYWRLRAADVNGDRRADIITTNSEGASVAVLLATADGFTAPRLVPTERSPFAVAIGDVNGDRHPDLAIAHYQVAPGTPDRLTILLGNGTGRFVPAPGSPFPTGRSSTAVAIGDVDGDGVGDVAVANTASNDVSLLFGGTSGLREAAGSPISVGEAPTSVVLADLDADGRAEILTANWGSGDVTVRSSR